MIMLYNTIFFNSKIDISDFKVFNKKLLSSTTTLLEFTISSLLLEANGIARLKLNNTIDTSFRLKTE